MSPSGMAFEEVEVGYMLVHVNGRCGAKGALLSKQTRGDDDGGNDDLDVGKDTETAAPRLPWGGGGGEVCSW